MQFLFFLSCGRLYLSKGAIGVEFTFDTVYDRKAVAAMARGLRMTSRKKHSGRSRAMGCIIAVLAVVQLLPLNDESTLFGARAFLLWAVLFLLFGAFVFEDRLNAFFARRRMMPGTKRATGIFTQDNYCTETAAGTTQWRYENIQDIAEDKHYFIFVFDKRYAQVYDKRTLSGGTEDEFRRFLIQRTGLKVQSI